MKIAKSLCAFCLVLAIQGFFSLRPQEFSQEKALDHLEYIAGKIGPRPLGSTQERAALTYFAEKMAEFGGKIEWQPVADDGRPQGKSALNTASFNVIARFTGDSPREIIVGAHVDSSTPEIPGADDDGSGVAAMLEIARVMSQSAHQSTLVFVAFCGEEAGLVGSKSFVEHYPLGNVALMLQLDMTSDEAPLMLWIDTKKAESPKWLVSASIDAFHSLGYRNIDYPTIFQSLNSAAMGAGSDHEPFLEKGIPAIGFVSDIRFPIHTRNDSLEYFQPEGLKRSGRLIVELLKKFDGGQPKEKTDRYALLMVGEKPVYVPLSWLAAGILVCLAVAVIALLRLYLNRKGVLDWEADQRIKKSWPKLLVLHIFILLVTFASLWLMQFLTGFRVPWLAHPGPHILYAFFFFIFGVWLALQILRRWRLRKNAFFYFVRSFGYFLFLVIIPWSAFGPRLAFFPAVGLLLISLAALVRWTWLKGILWLASPVLMFRLFVLPEYYQFIYRGVGGMGLAGVRTTPAFALMHLVLILFMTFWSQPFLLGLAAVYRSARGDLLGLKRFRRPALLVPVGMLLILGAVFLLNLPSYMKPWEQVISVTQEFDSEKNKTQVEFSSGDFLRGVTADIAGQMQTIEERECVKTIDYPLEMNWLKVNPEVQIEDRDKERMVSLKLALAMEKSPYTVSLLLKSDRLLKIDQANIRYRLSKNQVRVSWTCFPERSLRPELHLRLPKEARLDADITVSFLELPVRISAAGKNKFFIYRSQIKKRVELVKTPAAAKKS